MVFVALALGFGALLAWLVTARQIRRLPDGPRPPQPRTSSPLSADELAHAAWLEELEAKGQEILTRIERAKSDLTDLIRRAEALRGPLPAPAPTQADLPRPEQAAAAEVARPSDLQPAKVAAVLELAAQGDDAVAIARKLGLGTGEVRLILQLEEQQVPG